MFRYYFYWMFRLKFRLQFLLLWCILVLEVKSSTVIPPLMTKTPEEIEQGLLKHAVIPDVIDKAPKYFLMALFREHDEMPELGNVLNPNYLELFPYLLNWPCENTSLYTLIMTDPDSPSKYKPKNREWHHWLVGNIHTALEEGKLLPDIFEATTLSRYIPPIPKKGTGFHRYVLLVYKQPQGRIKFTEKYLSHEPHDIERANFSTRAFAKKYNLGDPLAVSFFNSEYVKPPPTTTLEPWYLPTDFLEDADDYPPMG